MIRKRLIYNDLVQNFKYKVCQRRIGFEFQTVGHKKNVEKVIKGRVEDFSEDDEKELYKVNSLSVQRDGHDLEYVTDSFDERNESDITKLKETINLASNLHKKYTKNSKSFFIIKNGKEEKCNDIKNIDKGWKINGDGTKNAHPQATVGIRLESIHDFIKQILNKLDKSNNYLLSTPKSVIKDTQARTVISAINKRISESNNPQLGPIQMGLAELVLQNVAMIKEFLSTKNKQGNRGLINAKNPMSFMSRTSLKYIYDVLNPNAKKALISYFKNQKEYNEKDAYVAYEEDDEDGNKDSYVLFSDWVNELEKNGKDILENKYNSISELSIDESGSTIPKKFNVSRPTDIGYDERNKIVNGALIELRALERNVPPNKWINIANNVIILLKDINNPFPIK